MIRDPDTGRKKAVATFTDAGVAEVFQGMLVGSLKPGGGNLVANWRTTFHENGAITAQIGGEAADGRLPAVVTGGRCKGPFERVEFTSRRPRRSSLGLGPSGRAPAGVIAERSRRERREGSRSWPFTLPSRTGGLERLRALR